MPVQRKCVEGVVDEIERIDWSGRVGKREVADGEAIVDLRE